MSASWQLCDRSHLLISDLLQVSSMSTFPLQTCVRAMDTQNSNTEIKWWRVNTVRYGVKSEWFWKQPCFLIWAFGCSSSFWFLQHLCILEAFLSSLWIISMYMSIAALYVRWLLAFILEKAIYAKMLIHAILDHQQGETVLWSGAPVPLGPWRLQVHHMAISL